MKRNLSLLIIIMLCFINVSAQHDSLTIKNRITIGVKGGFSFANMIYSDINLDLYKHLPYCKGQVGVFGDVDIWKGMSVGVEFLFTGRGARMQSEDFVYDL